MDRSLETIPTVVKVQDKQALALPQRVHDIYSRTRNYFPDFPQISPVVLHLRRSLGV